MKNLRTYFALLFCLIALCPVAYGQQPSLELAVDIHGGDTDIGQAIVSLFSTPENYMKEPVSEQIASIDNRGSARVVFGNLSAGEYAVSVIYDKDSDGALDTGFLGIPTEKIGFSNDAKGTFGPPSFEKSAFDLFSSSSIVVNLGEAN